MRHYYRNQLESAGHGNQKKCSVALDKILIEVDSPAQNKNVYDTDLKVGHFTGFEVYIHLRDGIGVSVDWRSGRYQVFCPSDRYNADILWFTKG